MGFKCPVCAEDFGRDKKKWDDHIKSAHQGVGNKIVSELKKITEDENETS